jgi:hypothetical protein
LATENGEYGGVWKAAARDDDDDDDDSDDDVDSEDEDMEAVETVSGESDRLLLFLLLLLLFQPPSSPLLQDFGVVVAGVFVSDVGLVIAAVAKLVCMVSSSFSSELVLSTKAARLVVDVVDDVVVVAAWLLFGMFMLDVLCVVDMRTVFMCG